MGRREYLPPQYLLLSVPRGKKLLKQRVEMMDAILALD